MREPEHVRGHRHVTHHVESRNAPARLARMAWRQRVAIYCILGTLWLSGCVWLLLDSFFAPAGQFGKTPHPLEPALLLMHGILAILSMYLLGWVSARHVLRSWPGRLRRVSGGILSAFFLVLTMSGFALFFATDDRWQHGSALLHEVLGILVTVFAIQHWLFARRRDIRRAASRP
ncbi:MAG: hypothetical protein M3N50_03130 [Pseudomonadota bacterium]|nr:hypothetical protein [Pseudomonadota bacterium]